MRWVISTLAVGIASLGFVGAAPGTPSRADSVSIRRVIIGRFQIMLISDKNTRECYGCLDAAQSQSNWGLVGMRRLTQLLTPKVTNRQANALGAALQADRSWGLAGFQLANNSDVYDTYVHRAIRYAWRAAGLLSFRPTLQALLLAADCPDWYLAATLPAYAPVTACTY
jgi:hypothetical protein